ncbi:MAG TPA: sigma 54-interacting transcriptional regulator, partial [Gemmataceae bacterium]|nr:sigma 54-interacting transcriptional regulator [Gemmataceae bacterium]
MAETLPNPSTNLPPGGDDPAADFRWAAFFQRSTEPLFVLNRRRQILFVNRVWEGLTGLVGRDVYKRVCKRQRDAEPGSIEAVLNALSPSREVMAGRQIRARRLIVQPGSAPVWWDVDYFPLLGPHGLLGIVGKIHVVQSVPTSRPQPLPEKLTALRQRLVATYGLQHLPTEVPAMRRVAEQLRLASGATVPVLLVGESGAGKEWLARTIHHESAQRENPFVALDCGHLPDKALAWALFGPPGFAQRAGATLYLQEPFHLPRELQSRLCEHFTRQTEDAGRPRLLAGTTAASDGGRWLEEFHCLLSPVTIQVPPLRERVVNLPFFVDRLLERASSGRDTPVSGLSDESWELVRAYSWPGNLHELYAVLAAACRRAKSNRVEAADLPWFLRTPGPVPERTIPLDKILEQVERRLLQWALAAAKGNK